MKRKSLSESDLIELIRAYPQDFPASIRGHIGDDCAVFETSIAEQLVVTSDLLLEGIHFKRNWISPSFLGRKSCLVNASDLAAMGARPYACLLGLGLPETLTGQYFQDLVTGFLQECAKIDMPLIGGDLSRSAAVVISVTALGCVDSGKPISRSGAKEGDSVLLIGKTGYSRLGLDYLKSSGGAGLAEISDEKALRDWADAPHCYEWLKAHFLPEIHLEAAVWIREMGLANSMIDVSDGLGHDLLHILEESQLSCEMQIEKLPCPSGVKRVEEARRYALNGGEDYALLLTVSGKQLSELERSYPQEFPPFRVIGRLSSGPVNLSMIDGQGQRIPYESEGFSHFK